MRVGQLPHLINLKLGQVGPATSGKRAAATFQIRDGPSPGKAS
jgi:hypothetical protein